MVRPVNKILHILSPTVNVHSKEPKINSNINKFWLGCFMA